MVIKFFRVLMLTLVTISSSLHAEQYDIGDLKYQIDESLIDRVKSLDENPERSTDISKVQKVFESQSFKEKVAGYKSQGLQALSIQVDEEYEAGLKLSKSNKLILFASSSMPLETLRNYVDDLVALDGIMVFRGTIGDISKLKPTIDFMRKVMVEDLDCMHRGCAVRDLKIAVNPKRFRHYQIQKVPAFVVETNPSFESNCNDKTPYLTQTQVIYGDASIASVLDELSRQGNNKEIATLQSKLRER